MTKRRKQRRNRRNNNGPAYKCVGVVVKNPNQGPLKKSTISDLFGAFAKTLPKYSFESLMALKKPALLEVASKEGVKVWKAWNKTRIAKAILAK